MLFQKYYFDKTPDSNGKSVTDWYMILQSVEDVLEYCKIDAEKLTMAWLRLPQAKKYSHLNTRESVINLALECAALTLEEGEKKSPLIVVSDFIDKKSQGMLKTFLKYGRLRVNMVGGYSPLDSFVELWSKLSGCKLIEELEKDGLGFPEEGVTTFDTDVIVLENDKSANWFVNELKNKHIQDGKDLNIHVITHLRERDTSYIIEMLSRTKAVAIYSMLIDEEQIMKFIKLFEIVKPLDIYLKVYKRGEELLNKIPEFVTLKEKHNIKFIE